MMNNHQSYFSVSDQFNTNQYYHLPKQSTLLEQAQQLIEEQQKIAMVKQMLAKNLLDNPTPRSFIPTAPSVQILSPRSMYSVSSSPPATPRDIYSSSANQMNLQDQIDLSRLDSSTLVTLSETLAALEQLKSPNFYTPDMILQMSAQNTAAPKSTPSPAAPGFFDFSPRNHYKSNQKAMFPPQKKIMSAPLLAANPNAASVNPFAGLPNMPCMLGFGQQNVQGSGLVPKLDFSQLAQGQVVGDMIDTAKQSARSDNNSVKFRSKREKKLYKTEVCLLWSEKGQCEFGDSCKYAHGDVELVQVKRHPKFKSELCKHFTESGTCPFGRRCHFSHDTDGSLSARAAHSDHDSANEEIQTPRRLPVFQQLAHAEDAQHI